MQVYPLLSQTTKKIRLKTLQYLRQAQYYRTAISLYGRLSLGKFSDSCFLITNLDVAADEARVVVLFDRSRRPETELWLFGDWEASTEPFDQLSAVRLLQHLFQLVKSLPIPQSDHASSVELDRQSTEESVDHSGLRREDYTSHAGNDNIMLCGAIHERTLPLLEKIGVLNPEFSHVQVPFLTYIFDNEHLPASKQLSSSLRWDELKIEHMDLVKSRTLIPRQTSTLIVLPSVGVFAGSSSQPVAWGFVGIDGSLSTLHVEPQYRGKGLAKILTHKLLTEKMDGFFQGGARRLGHAHVALENEASKRLCESVGGKADWSVHWVRADLSRLKLV